jgi:hypothetical protein
MNKTDKAVTRIVPEAKTHEVAIQLLRDMYINDSMPERVSTLAGDIETMAYHEFEGDVSQAVRELRIRLGGWKNLLSYSNCLVISARKRNGII